MKDQTRSSLAPVGESLSLLMSSPALHLPPLRRIVTTHNEQGVAAIQSDTLLVAEVIPPLARLPLI